MLLISIQKTIGSWLIRELAGEQGAWEPEGLSKWWFSSWKGGRIWGFLSFLVYLEGAGPCVLNSQRCVLSFRWPFLLPGCLSLQTWWVRTPVTWWPRRLHRASSCRRASSHPLAGRWVWTVWAWGSRRPRQACHRCGFPLGPWAPALMEPQLPPDLSVS